MEVNTPASRSASEPDWLLASTIGSFEKIDAITDSRRENIQLIVERAISQINERKGTYSPEVEPRPIIENDYWWHEFSPVVNDLITMIGLGMLFCL